MMRFLLHRGLIYILPLIGLAIAVVARVAVPDMLDRLMLISFDFYQRLAPREAGDVPIRIVDIDEAALSQYGQWPWSRSLDAELIDKLREAGAVVVALDVVFAEPDRTSPKLLLAQLSKHGEVDDETTKLLSNLPDPDERLVAALKSLPTVAGFILVDHTEMPPPIAKASFAFNGIKPLEFVDRFPSAVSDLPDFQKAAAGNGFLNQHVDRDQIVRRVPVIMRLGDKPVTSVVAETLRIVTGAKTYIARGAGSSADKSFGENTGMTLLPGDTIVVP